MAHYPLSRALLDAVLADRTSDRFVCQLVWSRLGYRPDPTDAIWRPGPDTPAGWADERARVCLAQCGWEDE